MFNKIDASGFEYSTQIYEREFLKILAGIISCYKMMIQSNVSLPNNENRIRDIIYNNYLKNNKMRNQLKLIPYIIDCEVAEYDNKGKLMGYVDYKISTQNTFIDTNAYYIIECKRLDNTNTTGTTGLNAEYIKNGILRFVNKKYSSYYKVNGMIGFIVARMDINSNVKNINELLKNNFKKANTKKELTPDSFINNFNSAYFSGHNDKNKKDLKLYHLMFDFSKNMEITN